MKPATLYELQEAYDHRCPPEGDDGPNAYDETFEWLENDYTGLVNLIPEIAQTDLLHLCLHTMNQYAHGGGDWHETIATLREGIFAAIRAAAERAQHAADAQMDRDRDDFLSNQAQGR